MQTFQELILKLSEFWAAQGCVLQQPYDLEVGAGTMHPDTFLRVLGPEPWRVAYVQPSRRPADGRYGENPFRLGKHYQFQVILKPAPADIQRLYVESLEAMGVDLAVHDLRFEEDNWEAPTLGAWGVGWQVMLDGMEITQFTYFQQAGGLDLAPISAEITYGLERITMFLGLTRSIYDIGWVPGGASYGQVRHQDEVEFSKFYFEVADVAFLQQQFEGHEREARRCLDAGLVLPAYECGLKCSHAFNVLDARGAVSVTERVALIKRVRNLAVACAKEYVASRERLGWPLMATAPVPEAGFDPAVQVGSERATGWSPSSAPNALDYLLEVRAEEIPARMLAPATAELAAGFGRALAACGLAPAAVETAFTPRRLVLVARGLPAREPDREERVVGPPVSAAFDAAGAPTRAGIGFATRCGVAPEALQRVTTEKGEYAAAVVATVGRPAAAVLAEVVPSLLAGLTWPKSMCWGVGEGPWVRPVHGIVSLLGGEVVPFDLFGVTAGAETVGHAVLSPAPFAVAGVDDYREQLGARGVEIDPAARREALRVSMERHAAELGGRLVPDEELLEKLAAICEIPGVMTGSFDAAFLDLPREVLATSLRDHQSALTVEETGEAAEAGTGERRLLPVFLTVMDRPDDPIGRVRAGNEWVVAARLADARFFVEEDRRVGLAARAEGLTRLGFHEKLGSYAAKSERIAALAAHLIAELGWDDLAAEAAAASRLLKADLMAETVKEFTTLQGVMGGLYAREEGQPEGVWQALYDQYLPASTDDALPRGRVGQVVGLADRLDTLAGIFGLGLVPTGSRDPFGLRRAAQGAVRIALEGGLAVDLEAAAKKAVESYGAPLTRTPDQVLADLGPFLADRLRHLLGLAGYAYDEIEAVLAGGAGAVGELPDLAARVEALHAARGGEAFLAVVLAAKRIAKIVKDQPASSLDAAALAASPEPAERALHQAFEGLRATIDGAAAARDYRRALAAVADLAPVLDRFFVEVLVMDEDPVRRSHRIALLQAIDRTISATARLTEVVVDKAEHRAKFG